MRKDVRKIAIGGVCVLTGVILIFGIKKGITVLKTEKTETKKGVEVDQETGAVRYFTDRGEDIGVGEK